ncbi:hypothetical protein [Pedobacter sp. JY14-1]|nr:hypothetical protein [Pedobacter sp. JY14-1]
MIKIIAAGLNQMDGLRMTSLSTSPGDPTGIGLVLVWSPTGHHLVRPG